MGSRSSMKNSIHFSGVLSVAVLLVASAAWAAPKPAKTASQNIPPFPGTLVNARYVYVTSYDGDQFDLNLLPEDRAAISAVQDAIQKWGKLVIVYNPGEADIILRLQSRPSEDVLAVYDGHSDRDQYLWRVMA